MNNAAVKTHAQIRFLYYLTMAVIETFYIKPWSQKGAAANVGNLAAVT